MRWCRWRKKWLKQLAGRDCSRRARNQRERRKNAAAAAVCEARWKKWILLSFFLFVLRLLAVSFVNKGRKEKDAENVHHRVFLDQISAISIDNHALAFNKSVRWQMIQMPVFNSNSRISFAFIWIRKAFNETILSTFASVILTKACEEKFDLPVSSYTLATIIVEQKRESKLIDPHSHQPNHSKSSGLSVWFDSLPESAGDWIRGNCPSPPV